MRSIAASAAAASTLLAPAASADSAPSPAAGPIALAVDATDVQRGLLHATLTIPVEPGPLDLYYVEWTPGNHNPSGPIQNVVDFYVKDARGNALDWRRDPAHVHRVSLTVPPDSRRVTVELSYICNQPSVISRSTDSYGQPQFGGLNWNTVLVYPGGADKNTLIFEPSITLPEDWKLATPLAVKSAGRGRAGAARATGERTVFEPCSLIRLVDSPVIFGANLATFEISAGDGFAPHFAHAVAKSEDLTKFPEKRIEKFAEMVRQAQEIFGPFPRSQFHFLLLVGDAIPGLGVEHCESTLISMGDKEIVNCEKEDGDPMTVVPHEYIHAWNGKMLVPEGLTHPDYHTPALTQMLWVYEGLTTYYTDVLAVRCGLLTDEEFLHRLTNRINTFDLQVGRRWRSVEDTAAGMRFLRAASEHWADLRRRQDYYSEGALFWMECDSIIRAGTDNQKSLDDFCRAFFKPRTEAPVQPDQLFDYTRADVVRALADVYPQEDWSALIVRRIERPGNDLTRDLPKRLGYTMDFAPEPTDLQKKDQKDETGANLRNSIGFSANKDGEITSVRPGSRADESRLFEGMKIISVNGKTFTPERLRDAAKNSSRRTPVALLVNIDGENIREFTFPWEDGLRYPRLAPLDGAFDAVKAIAAPR